MDIKGIDGWKVETDGCGEKRIILMNFGQSMFKIKNERYSSDFFIF